MSLKLVTYRVSKVINAPIKYVYKWATDYSEGDNSIWGGKYPRVILFKSRAKCVYASYKDGSDGKKKLAVRLVTLNPSEYSWHLDYYAEEDIETGEYHLTRLDDMKTRLNMVLRNKWKNGKGPSASDFATESKFIWEKYGDALEEDYASGKKANS
jgi:hypothetical protein